VQELARLSAKMWRIQAEAKVVNSCMADLAEELEVLQGDPMAGGSATLAEVDAQFTEMEHWMLQRQATIASLARQTQRLRVEL